MNTYVVDASVVIKWVVEEEGTPEALDLRQKSRLIAPELLVAECANILWKKVERDELLQDEAILAARLLQSTDIELLPTRSLLEAATRLAIETHHPAYDCVYLALALANDCQFVTADARFLRKLGQVGHRALQHAAISLTEAARL